MNAPVQKIIIVGGGTAGWLTANHLGKVLRPDVNPNVSIMLIESPDIPTVGVGEGTVPMMRETLAYFGISETEFLVKCDATFKQSIKFVDWLYSPDLNQSNQPNYYHHIFNRPQLEKFNQIDAWHDFQQTSNTPFAQAVSFQASLCESGVAPKLITHPEFQGFAEYGYHLDAGKFSKLLGNNAINQFGVKHLSANVTDAVLNDQGNIVSIQTDLIGEFVADLFVDCSGFRALLIEQQLGVAFVSKQHVLLADTALAMQVPYAEENTPILSHTVALAQQAGWIWDIGLTSRRGVGHVYSSSFTSDEQAEADLRRYVGAQSSQLSCRKIAMKVGHRKEFWVNNCVSIGLSQGFVEPLEATGLLVFDASARMLAELLPNTVDGIPLAARRFNQRMLYIWERVIDFIKLHYFLTRRNDSAFWLENQRTETVSDSLLEQLDIWRSRGPREHDFFSRYETFNLDNYLYVLYGMDYQSQGRSKERLMTPNEKLVKDLINSAPQKSVSGLDELTRIVSTILMQVDELSRQLEPNRILLNKIKRFGLQKR